MTPSYAVKNGVRYRYYISCALIQGQPDKAATLNRVSATEIETVIISALRKHLKVQSNNKLGAQGSRSPNDKDLISTHIARVDANQTSEARSGTKPCRAKGAWPIMQTQTPWLSLGGRRRQNGRARSFSPLEHLLVRICVRSEPRPAPDSSQR